MILDLPITTTIIRTGAIRAVGEGHDDAQAVNSLAMGNGRETLFDLLPLSDVQGTGRISVFRRALGGERALESEPKERVALDILDPIHYCNTMRYGSAQAFGLCRIR